MTNEFHVHVDAHSLAGHFEEYLVDRLGFYRSDFAGHPEGTEGYEPAHHLTRKTTSSQEFKELFEQVSAYAKQGGAMRGYIEGEFVPVDKEIEERPFDETVPLPLRLKTGSLPPGRFRETEIHIALSRDSSDPRLLQNLMEMGFFGAYLPKSYGVAAIFTAQGSRQDIDQILPALERYLNNAGGAVACSIKEERIANWWVSDPDLRLPPVVQDVLLCL